MPTSTPEPDTKTIAYLAEAARAWRHGNISASELIDIVDEFDAGLLDASIDLVEETA